MLPNAQARHSRWPVGPSYRSAIFYTSDEQREVAEDTIADVDASGVWPGNVVTEVTQAGPFWETEPEHQDYLLMNPGGYTCHFIRPNWRLRCGGRHPDWLSRCERTVRAEGRLLQILITKSTYSQLRPAFE